MNPVVGFIACPQLLKAAFCFAPITSSSQEEEKEGGKLLKIRTKKDLDALVQSGEGVFRTVPHVQSSVLLGSATAHCVHVRYRGWQDMLSSEPGATAPAGKKAVIKFWAPWCNKCRMIAPHVDELAVSWLAGHRHVCGQQAVEGMFSPAVYDV